MWYVTVCKGDYRVPIRFANFLDASDFMQSTMTSDECKDIYLILQFVEAK